MNTEEADEEEEEEEDLLSFKRFLGFLRTFLVHRYSLIQLLFTLASLKICCISGFVVPVSILPKEKL
ncbi:hypothetical protein ACSBR2_024560 [Camellia fascicularis]